MIAVSGVLIWCDISASEFASRIAFGFELLGRSCEACDHLLQLVREHRNVAFARSRKIDTSTIVEHFVDLASKTFDLLVSC